MKAENNSQRVNFVQTLKAKVHSRRDRWIKIIMNVKEEEKVGN